VIVVGAGLWIVRRRRPFNAEEIWTAAALLLWIAGDIAINLNIAETEAAKRWSVRLVIFMILWSDYIALRARQVVVEEAEETGESEETFVIEPERERERDKV
jgi:hypothetical protein